MRVSDFDYVLPPERIAQEACEPRDAARLLVHERAGGRTQHARVRDLPRLLAPGDLVVVNDTRVLRARFFGRRASGGEVELLLVERVADAERPASAARGHAVAASEPSALWRALLRPARRLKVGERLALEQGALEALLVERRRGSDGEPDPAWVVELRAPGAQALERAIDAHGRTPLPPYIRRASDDPRSARDRERYQTLFAQRPGAVAAPTAGLHFTAELVAALAERGVELARVTLHVGEGTFRAVTAPDVADHRMHAETFEVSAATAAAVARCRARRGRVVAVGTTTVRALESAARTTESGRLGTRTLGPASGATELFLTPGAEFRVVDALLTNFHLPRSTLLMLVSAFAGREPVLGLYREAIEREYRFFSYGDAMLLL